MTLLIAILRFILILFFVRLVFRGLTTLLRPRPGIGRSTAGVDMVRDRVCNTFLPRDRALLATVGGREEHFCSAACRDRAQAAIPAP